MCFEPRRRNERNHGQDQSEKESLADRFSQLPARVCRPASQRLPGQSCSRNHPSQTSVWFCVSPCNVTRRSRWPWRPEWYSWRRDLGCGCDWGKTFWIVLGDSFHWTPHNPRPSIRLRFHRMSCSPWLEKCGVCWRNNIAMSSAWQNILNIFWFSYSIMRPGNADEE